MLTRAADRAVMPSFSGSGKEVVLVYVTWSDLISFIIMLTGIIALAIKIHKK